MQSCSVVGVEVIELLKSDDHHETFLFNPCLVINFVHVTLDVSNGDEKV